MMSSNTRLSDIVLEDRSLSMTAKGAFVSIGFLGNGCTLEQLVTSSTNDEASVTQALKELEDAGYVHFDEAGGYTIKAPSSFGSQD